MLTESDFERLEWLRRIRVSRVMSDAERSDYVKLIDRVMAMPGLARLIGIDKDPPAFDPAHESVAALLTPSEYASIMSADGADRAWNACAATLSRAIERLPVDATRSDVLALATRWMTPPPAE